MHKDSDGQGLFGQFSSDTSLHGVRHISGSSTGTRRYFWGVALLCMLVLLVYVVVNQVMKFTSYPFYTVNTLRQTHSLPFPSVTVCNSNLFRKSVVTQDPNAALSLRAMYDRGPKAPDINFSDPRFVSKNTECDPREYFQSTAHQLESMFRFCSWMSEEVNCAEYLTPRHTNHGLCYTFNSMDYIDKHGRLNVKNPGEAGGLKLTIDIEEHEYYYGLSSATGIKVLVHDPHIFPNMYNRGFLVGPGTKVSASVSITKCRVKPAVGELASFDLLAVRQIHLTYGQDRAGYIPLALGIKCLPPPFKAMGNEECVDIDVPGFESPLDFYSTYDIQACYMECAAKVAIAECGCQDVFDHAANVSHCSIRELVQCYRPSKAKHERSTKSLEDCKCSRQCNWDQYDVRVSSGGFPMEHDVQQIMENRNVSREYVLKNYLSVDVFYEQLVFTEIEQVPSYTAVDIVANLGGQLGIFLGASFLTLTEVAEYLTGALFVVFSRRKTHVQAWTADNTEKTPDKTSKT